MGTNQAFIPAPVLEDRKAFFNFMDFSRLESDLPHLTSQVLVALDVIESQLADGRLFMTGPERGLPTSWPTFRSGCFAATSRKLRHWVAALPRVARLGSAHGPDGSWD
jgi:hypothetical protein